MTSFPFILWGFRRGFLLACPRGSRCGVVFFLMMPVVTRTFFWFFLTLVRSFGMFDVSVLLLFVCWLCLTCAVGPYFFFFLLPQLLRHFFVYLLMKYASISKNLPPFSSSLYGRKKDITTMSFDADLLIGWSIESFFPLALAVHDSKPRLPWLVQFDLFPFDGRPASLSCCLCSSSSSSPSASAYYMIGT